MRVLRENRRASFLAVLIALALLVSVAVVRDETSSGTLNRTMSAGTSLQVSCAGTSLTTTSTSATTVNLNCLTKAPAVPVAVGHATTFASGDSGSPSTTLPAGVTAGDVLVSYVESYSFTSISCKAGWTEVFDSKSSGGARLAACTTVVTAGQANPQAIVSPPTQVSMVTMAFSGVSATAPVDASAAGAGSVSPTVTTDTAGTLLVFGEGSSAWKVVAQAPAGSILGAALNNSGNSQVAVRHRGLQHLGADRFDRLAPPDAAEHCGGHHRPSPGRVRFLAAGLGRQRHSFSANGCQHRDDRLVRRDQPDGHGDRPDQRRSPVPRCTADRQGRPGHDERFGFGRLIVHLDPERRRTR